MGVLEFFVSTGILKCPRCGKGSLEATIHVTSEGKELQWFYCKQCRGHFRFRDGEVVVREPWKR